MSLPKEGLYSAVHQIIGRQLIFTKKISAKNPKNDLDNN